MPDPLRRRQTQHTINNAYSVAADPAGIRKTLAHKVIDFREAIRLEQLSGEAQRASGHQASSFSSLSVGITSASSTSRSYVEEVYAIPVHTGPTPPGECARQAATKIWLESN
jgi:hypothetical protein